MGKTKLDETYILKTSIKMRFFWCSYWYQNSIFLSFGYYWAGSLLTTVRYHELFDKQVKSILNTLLQQKLMSGHLASSPELNKLLRSLCNMFYKTSSIKRINDILLYL